MKGETMKIPKQAYTAEFKKLAVTRVKDGMTAGAAAKELGLIEQTLRNWVKAAAAGTLNGVGAKVVTTAPRDRATYARPPNPKKRDGVLRKGHAVKYAWIDEQRNDYALDAMCSVLEISVSGYRSWKRGGTPDRTRLTDAQMLALIRVIHEALKGAYGSPRMVKELRGRGFPRPARNGWSG
jgi:transposase-like protein